MASRSLDHRGAIEQNSHMKTLSFVTLLVALTLVGCGEADRSGDTRQVDPTASEKAAEAAMPKPPAGAQPTPAIPEDAQSKMPKVAPGVGTK